MLGSHWEESEMVFFCVGRRGMWDNFFTIFSRFIARCLFF